MDYKNIYYKIIENAKEEDKNGKRSVGYFEKHHIQPKSLGGNNDSENLVKLTAREHFICHWLLVIMHDKGSIERNKMLCALWRMHGDSTGNRYINSRAYEKLRIEFAQIIGQQNSINQLGNKNSQYGTKWYTNKITGESKKFKNIPSNEWIIGRNLFHGETCSIAQQINSYMFRKKLAYNLWSDFKQSNCDSVNKFSELIGYSQQYICRLFKEHIHEYVAGKGNHKNNVKL